MSAPAFDPASFGSGDPTQQLLEQLAGEDPRFRLVAQLMHARAAETAAAPTANTPVAHEPDERLLRRAAAGAALREQYLRLAAALGACPRCWGEDARCRECGGAGTSGFFAPDPDLFLWYVVPAVRRARAEGQARIVTREARVDRPETQSEG